MRPATRRVGVAQDESSHIAPVDVDRRVFERETVKVPRYSMPTLVEEDMTAFVKQAFGQSRKYERFDLEAALAKRGLSVAPPAPAAVQATPAAPPAAAPVVAPVVAITASRSLVERAPKRAAVALALVSAVACAAGVASVLAGAVLRLM